MFIGLGILFGRQYKWQDSLFIRDLRIVVESSEGRIWVSRQSQNFFHGLGAVQHVADTLPEYGQYEWWFHFESHTVKLQGVEIRSGVAIPLWFLMLVLAIPPVWSFITLRRSRKLTSLDHRVCASCGYDLRGSSGNTCPECGERFSSDEE